MAAEADVLALEHMLDEWAVAWSSGNADKLMPLFTTDADYEDVTFGAVNHGPDAIRKFATDAFEAFPGSTFALKSRFVGATGKWGAMEWVSRGRQTKDLPGLPAPIPRSNCGAPQWSSFETARSAATPIIGISQLL